MEGAFSSCIVIFFFFWLISRFEEGVVIALCVKWQHGSPDDGIDYVLDAPPHQADPEQDATDNHTLPPADGDSVSGCVTPPADSEEEQDLYKHMLDYITDSVQQMDTDRAAARREPDQEAEIMAFLMKRLSGKHRLWC